MDSADKRVVLITGTSLGIGKAAAVAFQEARFTVFATERDGADLEDLKAKGCHNPSTRRDGRKFGARSGQNGRTI